MLSATGGLYHPLLSICLALFLLLIPGEAYKDISDATLTSLPRPNGDFDIHNGALLAPILQPRVPGTPGATAVLEHLVNYVRTTLPNWHIELHNSTSTTPVSKGTPVKFVNIIASRDPPWANKGDIGRLNLVAHYDSKLEPTGFIGAIDSAAPCAMIMHAMRSIDAALTAKWEKMRVAGHTLEDAEGIQVIFMDGEEAFQSWSDDDSLYGARALAEQWDSEVNPALSTYKTPLSSISVFMLLDLLGAKDPTIQSYFEATHWAYKKLAALERRFRALKQFKSTTPRPWFPDAAKSESQIPKSLGIGDDHVPFLHRGVEILHIIDAASGSGMPFPAVWHTIDDDAEHLDMDTVEDWSMLVTAFAAEWLELEEYMSASGGNSSTKDAGHQNEKHSNWARKTEFS
ncbi:hypothetical protein P168DRAFT_292179 [Aspergillus campestris IBT 28561]|uniref:Peptide hydrolase n=1 Tax=Aspergillus campestris (strain IBT 28561) TaxID=1392248 RepID=A0A2I1CWR7_ASPC2|nr:uncharacterized protein P168DRAFT_292179 [Aspergillus campestris IBT 28561]PKY02071.1 hypothetical protein P168DRAFT_292179 [Aspergillus campestris IBT 28561]